ncbi:Cuticle protein 19-like [Homarus americanus]|uniref:Cuticle protein 19-like n=2 Tax=Homarus americanus TaxID=6706 RepID=A0A8J5MY37_HOMAM|nr:Cuticle protein 19-like [Homarus americanus]
MMAGMPYDFGWGVNDPNSGNQFSQKEESDGNVVRGQYSVLLPDGRTQIVKYFDDGNGFNVELSYE